MHSTKKASNQNLMKILGDNIRLLRQLQGYSQEYLAECLQITQSVFSKIENGNQKMRVERLIKLSEILNVEPEILLNRNSFTVISEENLTNINTSKKEQFIQLRK